MRNKIHMDDATIILILPRIVFWNLPIVIAILLKIYMKISKSNKIRIGVFCFVLEYKPYFTPLKDSPAAQEQSIFGQRNNT